MDRNRILFVDDEPMVTAALKRAFRAEPYETLSAESGEDALDLLALEQVDVIISDEQMPQMSGSELFAVVRRRYPQTIRMILTGHASLETAIAAINAGEVYRFFTKPCNEVDLKVSIRQALHQRDLAAESRRLLREYQKQSSLLREIELKTPGIGHVETDDSGAILLEDSADGDSEELLRQIRREIDGQPARA